MRSEVNLLPESIVRYRRAAPEASGPFVIVDIPPTRKSAAEPTAVPVVHSPAYFLQVEENNLVSRSFAVVNSDGL